MARSWQAWINDLVIFPGFPLPTGSPSTETIGTTSYPDPSQSFFLAVPVSNIESKTNCPPDISHLCRFLTHHLLQNKKES